MPAVILPRPMLKTAGPKTHNSWQAATPRDSHFVPARCEEVDCPHHLQGWITTVPVDSPQASYIRHISGRAFVEHKTADGVSSFHFKPGQQCFRPHFRKLERGPWLFVVNGSSVSPASMNARGAFSTFAEKQSMDWEDWRDQMNEQSFRYNRRFGLK
jgi:hypothetical protein